MSKRKLYQQEIDKLTKVIKNKYQPNKIILFGSVARGEFKENSDIDMLIIKNSKKKRYYRTLDVLNLTKNINRQLPFEPIIMTSQEFNKGLKENYYFIRQIMRDGKILYEI